MPWLPIYASESDMRDVFSLLNSAEEISFLIGDGPGKWIASKKQDYAGDSRYCIWHIPSGSLPLLRQNGQDNGIVPDPWRGWHEELQGADPTTPFFGAGHPGIIWLNARVHSKRKKDGIGLSSFEWIGNHYRTIGNGALETTEKFWKKLGRMIKRGASRIPRNGSWDGPRAEIWALSEALSKIQQGTERDENP